ncbi:hypothetical protein CR532_03605 [Candidatus Borreliella tachyglossi]|uniref:SCP domain-containing protein n=1 Tax=Candidatus Borreliella tachyglossi TaxID=1964448 RepID=A0A2S1LXN6_9SPIR|nr:CAP domain-containing protein [Candidatus Borreliella tachyglossi]AWG43041.1 hypothetical protein CR532_03605 [Candidatus Borreliella tachyglossi]
MQKKFILIIVTFINQAILISANEDLTFLYSSIHQLRDNLRLEKLEIDKTLEMVAKEYAISLNENKVLTHTLFGTTPIQRVKKHDKYFCRVREILAYGMEVRDVTGAWLNSPSHKEALLNKDTSKMGGYILQTPKKENIFIVIFGEKF